jgi:hypothetical protein
LALEAQGEKRKLPPIVRVRSDETETGAPHVWVALRAHPADGTPAVSEGGIVAGGLPEQPDAHAKSSACRALEERRKHRAANWIPVIARVRQNGERT